MQTDASGSGDQAQPSAGSGSSFAQVEQVSAQSLGGSEQFGPGVGAQTQPLAGSGSSFAQVEQESAQSLGGSESASEQCGPGVGAQTQPLAGRGSESSFDPPFGFSCPGSHVNPTNFDDVMTVTSEEYHSTRSGGHGGLEEHAQSLEEPAQPLASEGGEPHLALVALTTCMQELEAMKELEEWEALWRAAERHVLHPRRALAQHVTTACQPQKEEGPAHPSLKHCGIENPIPASGGHVSIELKIPNAFCDGDGLEIVYVSPAFPNLASAQKHACLELLCFLLVTAPTKVIMHPHEYINHLTSIEELRAIGQEVRARYMQKMPAFGGTISMAERITDMLPRARPPSKRSMTRTDIPPPPGLAMTRTDIPPPPGLAIGANDDFVVQMLQDRLIPEQRYANNKLPVWVWPKGLLPFLQRHSTIFEINYTGGTNRNNKARFQCATQPPPPPLPAAAASGAMPCGATQPPASKKSPPTFGATQKPVPPPPVRQPPLPSMPSSSTASASGEVKSGAAMPGDTVAQWKVQDVQTYLNFLELGHLTDMVRAEGIDGQALMECSEADLQEIGFSKFQSKKIKQRLPQP